jgi:hypothetical protein
MLFRKLAGLPLDTAIQDNLYDIIHSLWRHESTNLQDLKRLILIYEKRITDVIIVQSDNMLEVYFTNPSNQPDKSVFGLQ